MIDAIFQSHRGASFSPCRKFRYLLWRTWDDSRWINFLCLNPSTADEVDNDPTVERCERRARRLGFGGLIVTNIFAYRETDRHLMMKHPEPIGVNNDAAIVQAAGLCDVVLCAWGNEGAHLNRSEAVRKLLLPHADKCRALLVNKSGEPKHPLYCGYEMPLQEYSFILKKEASDVAPKTDRNPIGHRNAVRRPAGQRRVSR